MNIKKLILSVLFLVSASVVYSEDNFRIIVKDSKGAYREDAYVTAPRMADDFLLAGDGFSEKCKTGGTFSKQIAVNKTPGKDTHYEVYAAIPGYGVSKRQRVKVGTTSIASTTLTVQKSGSISGKLTLPDGKPTKEAYIVLCEEDGTKIDEIEPDSIGNYQYKELPPGRYKLYLIHEPETTNLPAGQAGPVYPARVIQAEIKEGEAKRQDISFKTGTATLTGRYAGFGEHLPAGQAGTMLALFKEGEYQNPMSRPYLKQYTDKKEGTYDFKNIEPGNYELCAIAIDEPPKEEMNPGLVLLYHKKENISSGENKRDIAVPNQPRSEMEGDVMYKNNSAVVPEAIIELVNSGGEVICETTADLQGHYLIKRVPIGKYQIKITRQIRQMFAGNTPVLADYEKSRTYNRDFVTVNKTGKQNLNLTLP